MRLTCPNCGAQYEVPDEVIPDSGRDVQCSNCGDTWFQYHPDHPPEPEEDSTDAPQPEPEISDAAVEEDVPEEQEPEDIREPEFKPEPEPEENVEVEFVTDDEPEPVEQEVAADLADDEPGEEEEHAVRADDGSDDEVNEAEETDFGSDDGQVESEPEPEPEPEPEEPSPVEESVTTTPRGLDPSVADVLRQEAAREEEARARESGGDLEFQPDLGLDGQPDDEAQRSQETRSRMARMRGLPEDGIDEPEEPEVDPALISRRNLLPDIDEINSSLDSESARAERDLASDAGGGAESAQPQKSEFNRGFMRVVLLVLILWLLYLLAPIISENIPALSGVMSGYEDMVNAARLWLNDLIAPQ